MGKRLGELFTKMNIKCNRGNFGCAAVLIHAQMLRASAA